MYDQLPMQVSQMERERQLTSLLREAEVRRALGHGLALSARVAGWVAAIRDRAASVTRPRRRQSPTAPCRTELGSSPVA